MHVFHAQTTSLRRAGLNYIKIYFLIWLNIKPLPTKLIIRLKDYYMIIILFIHIDKCNILQY